MTTRDLALVVYFLKRVVVRGDDEEVLLGLVDRLETELRNVERDRD